MSESMIACCLAAGCTAAVLFLGLRLRSEKRVRALEQEVRRCSEVIGQMMELQMRQHQRFVGSINDIEERMLGFAAPGSDSPTPVDRRHQVLTLSRRGFGLEEIARRLSIPKGEAELILSLRKYVGASAPGVAADCGEAREHAQA